MINQQRMLDHLLELVQIDSESFEEKEVADKLADEMRAIGGEVTIDDAGEKVGGNTGNVFVRFSATAENAEPIFLSAHMDTVVPGKGVKPKVVDGRVVTDGTTILGGDDKSGCSIILEAMRTLKEKNIPHGEIEICFSIAEEQGLEGAKLFDVSQLNAHFGIVLDSDDPGQICVRAPAADRMEWVIHGKEAHAGVEPEKGISAVKIAANAIASVEFGRIDEQTTSNIGVVEAGGATNIISKQVKILGEARSMDEEKLTRETKKLSQAFHDAVANAPSLEIEGETIRARLDEKIERDYEAMNVSENSPIVRLLQQAAVSVGTELVADEMGGGCDANVFNERGLETVNFGTGMREIHTVKEWLDIKGFHETGKVVAEALKMIGEGKKLTEEETAAAS
ncbi:MAG: M20/M25/M40 family metallo-hydrolase [Thermoanaerobaculia bacterium]|nr:M20/M25/M40 family metallo-hydrolase [Thermoanaerobaculia bacterium]